LGENKKLTQITWACNLCFGLKNEKINTSPTLYCQKMFVPFRLNLLNGRYTILRMNKTDQTTKVLKIAVH